MGESGPGSDHADGEQSNAGDLREPAESAAVTTAQGQADPDPAPGSVERKALLHLVHLENAGDLVLFGAYDPATDLFYFLGVSGQSNNPDSRRLWAVGRDGAGPAGFPLQVVNAAQAIHRHLSEAMGD